MILMYVSSQTVPEYAFEDDDTKNKRKGRDLTQPYDRSPYKK